MLFSRGGESQHHTGLGFGPASYLVTASDTHPVTLGNHIFKFADDTYCFSGWKHWIYCGLKAPVGLISAMTELLSAK